MSWMFHPAWRDSMPHGDHSGSAPVTEPAKPVEETFVISGETLERLRDIQIEWGLETLQEAFVHAVDMCPERYSDE